ncbi:Uu.00g129840.m01.CDS01 [Anthostomella pinea]|uniref:Uu.00g129840.m01.CDS01 n=1 Tax=Anthostomella pinea TaxID=933095 RepID=A0AAI8VJI6_9PEZI|nr:Uu.00g129840.m01.CDS01 [Anthostomella pinea]
MATSTSFACGHPALCQSFPKVMEAIRETNIFHDLQTGNKALHFPTVTCPECRLEHDETSDVQLAIAIRSFRLRSAKHMAEMLYLFTELADEVHSSDSVEDDKKLCSRIYDWVHVICPLMTRNQYDGRPAIEKSGTSSQGLQSKVDPISARLRAGCDVFLTPGVLQLEQDDTPRDLLDPVRLAIIESLKTGLERRLDRAYRLLGEIDIEMVRIRGFGAVDGDDDAVDRQRRVVRATAALVSKFWAACQTVRSQTLVLQHFRGD